jgi:hypothetical protein
MQDPERLLHMYDDQRSQLAFRRSRENEIFTWTASVLLAFLAGALLVKSSDRPALLQTPEGILLASLALSAITLFSVVWQLKQRQLMAEHQRMLVAIQDALGCFLGPANFPAEWKKWGMKNVTLRERLFHPSKIAATVLIGIMAIAAAALSGNEQTRGKGGQNSGPKTAACAGGSAPNTNAAPDATRAPRGRRR